MKRNLETRVKKLEDFEYVGNKVWWIEAIEGKDEWYGSLKLTDTGKIIDRTKEPMTFEELMVFKKESEHGVFIDVRNAL